MEILTCFKDLDNVLEGFSPSELVVIAARPAMGKTTFAVDIAWNALIEQNKSVVFISLEFSKSQLFSRLMADAGAHRERGGSKLSIEIEDDSASISEICDKCRRYKREGKADLIIIDYLQLIYDADITENAHSLKDIREELAVITRSLKALAVELDVPVVVTSQLGRTLEQRPDKRPVLSDLNDTIVKDADVILFIYRDELYYKDTEEPGVAEISVAKQSNGISGTVELAWRPRIVNLYKDSNDEYYANDRKTLHTFADLEE